MDIKKYIGEATEYDKKQEVESRQGEELAEKRECLCQWCWRLSDIFPNMIKIWQEEHEGAEIHYMENVPHVPQNVPHDVPHVPQNVPHSRLRGDDLDEWIAYQLAVHPQMTTEELASLSNLSAKIIKHYIAGMQRLKFVGSGANGYWVVGPKVENPKSKKGNQASGQASGQVSDQAGDQVSDQVSDQASK